MAYDTQVLKPAVSTLTNEGYYYIYDAHADDGTATETTSSNNSRYAFRFDSGAADAETAAVNGTHTKPVNSINTLENKHVWQAFLVQDNVWQFKNVATGRYMAQASAQTTSVAANYGSFDLEPVANQAGVFKVKVHGTTNTRWDGNGTGVNPMVYWGGSGHDIKFYSAVADGDDEYVLDTENGWNVTFTYPEYRGVTFTETISIADGENAANHIPAKDFFVATGLSSTDCFVGESNKAFNVVGNWVYPVTENVYRIRIKPGDSSSNPIRNDGAHILSHHNTSSDVCEAEMLWYFKLVEYTSSGELKVTLHSLVEGDTKGVYFTNVDNAGSASVESVFSENPTVFVVQPTTWASRIDGDFCLKMDGVNNWANDRNPYFSTWNNSAATNDPGSVVRIQSLTDSDIDEFTRAGATDEELEAVRQNPTPELVKTLLGKIAAMQVYTVNVVKGDVNYGTFTHRGLPLPELPTTLGNYGEIDDNFTATFTLSEGVEPFKMVNSRRLNQWLTTDDNGLYRTASSDGSFAAGEWFIQQNVTDGIKIFVPSKGKYVGGFTSGAQIPFADSYAAAATMTIENDQNGPSVIINNSLGMNLWNGQNGAGTIAGYRYIENDNKDASCYWFIVYDEDAFNSNIVNYYVVDTTADIPVNNSTARFLNTGIWYVAQQAAKDAITAATTAAVEAAEIAKVQALVDAAAIAQFGKKGTDITAMVTSLNEATATLNTATANADQPELFNNVKATGDAFIAMGFGNDEQRSAWETATNVTGKKTFAVIEALTASLNTLVADASIVADNVSIRIESHNTRNQYITPTDNLSNVSRLDDTKSDRQAFTVKHANENGFYLFSEYANKYIKTNGASNHVSLVNNASDATVLYFDVYNAQTAQFGIGVYGQTGYDSHLHTNQESQQEKVVCWSSGDASSWYLSSVSSDEALSQHIAGAKAQTHYNADVDLYPYGSEVGQYTITGATYAQATAALATVDNTETTYAERYAAADILFGITAVNINLPQAGHFYRLSGVNDYANKYLSSALYSSGRFSMVNGNQADTDNTYSTLFYFDGEKLIAVDGGLALGTMADNNNRVPVVATNGATYSFEGSNIVGKYFIKSGNYYIFNASADIDSGSGHDERDGYRWTITEAKWIPLPGSDNRATTSICSPVALDFEKKSGYAMYTPEVDENGKIILTRLSGSVIPANTPVVLTFNRTAVDPTNQCVFAKVGNVDANEETRNNYMSKAKEAGVNYIAMTDGAFSAVTTDYIPGFKPVLTVPEVNEEGYAMMEDKLHTLLFDPEGKVYTIKNSDTTNNRGYLVYSDAQNVLWTSNKLGMSNDQADAEAPTNVNYHWTFIPDGEGNYYLYNLGAQKFAAAFEVADNATHFDNDGGCHAEFYWHFSDYPTAVSVEFGDYDEKISLGQSVFNIYGGQNNHPDKGDRLPGMVIVNGYAAPVPGIAGNTSQNGCGFIFTEVACEQLPATPGVEELEAVKSEMEQVFDHALRLNEHVENNISEVGFYSGNAATEFTTAFIEGYNAETAEDKYYAVIRGHNAVTEKTYNGFNHNEAYQLTVGNDRYINAADNEQSWELGDISASDVDRKYLSNWHAEVAEDGQITFSHVLSVPAPEEGTVTEPETETEPENSPAAVRRRAEGEKSVQKTVAFTATPAYDGLGNVTLNLEGLNGAVRVASLGDDSDGKKTTAITEIELVGPNANSIYDLQGRRVSVAARRGLYIVNGRLQVVK
ncbi:MAG: hypothetical protein NC301_04690 [Bacteroides sp.]|nr:hypothetical protein [Bacteroides sp.]